MKRVSEFQQRALQTDDQDQSQSQRLQPPPPPQNQPQDQRTTMSMPSQTGPQSRPSLPAVPLDPRTTGNRSQEEIIKAGNQVFADIEKSLSGSIPKVDPNSARPTFGGTPDVVSSEDEIPSLESESLMPQTPQSSARTTAQFPHQSGAARTSGGWPEQPPAPAPGWQQQAQQAASQQGASKPTAESAMPSKADLAAIPTPTNLSGGAPKPNQASRPSAADLNAIPTPTSKPSTGGAKASPSRTELDAIPTPSQTTSQKMPAQTSSQKMPVQQAPSGAVKKPKKKISGLASVVLAVVVSSCLLVGVVLLANGVMHYFHTKQTIDMAMLFFKDGNYQLACKKFDEYIQNNTQDVSAYFYRAITSAKLGDFEKAASDYDQILRLRPGSPKALAGRASIRIKLADYEGAVADTDAALKARPGDFDSLRIRSIAYVHLGQFDKALADCNQCMQKNPTRGLAEIYSSRGFAYYRMKKFAEALSDYNRAIEISPKDINAHSSRAQVYSTMKKYEQALDDLNKVTYWSPRNASAYMLRAQTYKALKKKEKAMQDYDMVITLMPTPENYQTRADVHLEYGDIKGAVGDLDHILELQPANKKVQERRKALFAKVLAERS
jgi:tetratricopeptide (TPR) repeat protein